MGHTDRTAQSETSDQSHYVIRAGELAHDSYELDLTPERAGWEWSSLRVVALAPGKPLTVPAGEHEYLVLPLSGGCTVQAGSERLEVAGRESVFTDITDYVYVPRRTEVTLTSADGARIALPGSKATTDKPLRYCPRSEVGTGLRGAGPSSRQVNNYALGNDVETSHLLACEVLTPGGNWSSYPPHKHDEHTEVERVLEEIYYYQVRTGEGDAEEKILAEGGFGQLEVEFAVGLVEAEQRAGGAGDGLVGENFLIARFLRGLFLGLFLM